MKFKRSLLFIVSMVTVTGCATNAVTPEKVKDYLFYEVKEGVNVEDLYGTPWLNSAVEGMMERIVKPSEKDDFFANINYDYIQSFDVPKGKRRAGGSLGNADDETEEQLYTLISSETTSPLSTYISNAANYLKDGAKEQIKAKIDTINSYTTKDEINDYLSTVDSLANVASFLTPYYYYGYLTVSPGGILDSKGILYLIYSYRTRTSTMQIISNAIKDLFIAVGYSEEEAASFINGYTSKEAKLVKHFSFNAWGGVTQIGNLDEVFTGYQIEELARSLGYEDTDKVYYLDGMQEYINAFNALSLEDAKQILINRLMYDYAPITGIESYNKFLTSMASFEFESFNTSKDEEALVETFEKISSKILEKAYYDVYCDAEVKEQVMNLIQDIKDEYKVVLENNDWLTETTKKKAISKVEKMGFEACYPESIKDYPEFKPIKYSSALDLYGEMTLYNKNAKMFDTNWYWPCYTVNGAYSPTSNDFLIFNGILAGGIFSLENTTEEIYARLGSVIGHEISHAFDATGSQFDENGNQYNWWTQADRTAFNTKISKMIAYINNIEVKKDVKMRGNKVNGEVTADMGGIRVMLSLAKKVQNFDYKKFFENYAKVWAFKYAEDAVKFLNNNDEHPLGYIRTNLTLAQFDEFIETYDIKLGDGMYIDPEKRIAIW